MSDENTPSIDSASPAADRSHPFTQLPQRSKAIAQLQCGRTDQRNRQNREGGDEGDLEPPDRRLDFLGRRRHLNEIDAVITGVDGSLDDAQAPVVGTLHVATARAACAQRNAGFG